ncbi:hypothetical protein chiPu_0026835, partial [Chiloscyllium punctatum]|nr:hypothetical protein [Chiloscyllium punctatum]
MLVDLMEFVSCTVMKDTAVQVSELLCFLTKMLQLEQQAEEDDDDKDVALGLAKEYR